MHKLIRKILRQSEPCREVPLQTKQDTDGASTDGHPTNSTPLIPPSVDTKSAVVGNSYVFDGSGVGTHLFDVPHYTSACLADQKP